MVISSEVIAASARVYVHPSAICECEQIGEGTRVWAFAHVMDGAIVGSSLKVDGNVWNPVDPARVRGLVAAAAAARGIPPARASGLVAPSGEAR